MSGIGLSLELLRKGQEIVAPSAVLKLSAERACRRIDVAPYSIAENIAHAANWQQYWLAKLGAAEAVKGDWMDWNWPKVEPREWPAIRRRFLEGLDKAIEVGKADLDDQTEFVLNQILIHNTYHVGQCVLLKRMLAAVGPQVETSG